MTNKQRMLKLLSEGVRDVAELAKKSHLNEQQVLSALRNLQYKDEVPLKIRTEMVKVTRVIY